MAHFHNIREAIDRELTGLSGPLQRELLLAAVEHCLGRMAALPTLEGAAVDVGTHPPRPASLLDRVALAWWRWRARP